MDSDSPSSGSGEPESTPRKAGVTNVDVPRTRGSTTAPTNKMINYDLLTEGLGLESSATDDSEDLAADPPSSTESRSPRKRTGGSVRDVRTELSGFPPRLTALSESGRPRFKLIKERTDGRLKITSVMNDDPVVVRVNPIRDRGMRTEMVLECGQECKNESDDQDGQEDITDDEGVKQAKKRAKTVTSAKGESEDRQVGQESKDN